MQAGYSTWKELKKQSSIGIIECMEMEELEEKEKAKNTFTFIYIYIIFRGFGEKIGATKCQLNNCQNLIYIRARRDSSGLAWHGRIKLLRPPVVTDDKYLKLTRVYIDEKIEMELCWIIRNGIHLQLLLHLPTYLSFIISSADRSRRHSMMYMNMIIRRQPPAQLNSIISIQLK